ncbi:MAG: hypothetical protein H6737_21765 [Alphaproteobacteria bacterium]|nr:hypothetical protein [Alphaproteobacteria bacterium]
MSTRPDDALLVAVADADVWADAVEAHLDAHPLPVDAAEIDAAADRLEARLGLKRRRWPLASLVLAAAGLAAVSVWRFTGPAPIPSRVGPEPAAARRAEVVRVREIVAPTVPDAQIELLSVRRTVTLAAGTRVLSSEGEKSAVLLVQEGEAHIGETSVPEDHWALLTTLEDGSSAEVVFPDGQAPPPLEPDVWGGTRVQPQLERVRWHALPDRTLDTLKSLLEEAP